MGHREALLQGARRCLETRGYARTTARDLVAESDTNLASIGYHFGSKEALLNEAIGEAFGEWTDRLGRVAFAAGDASALERIEASWGAMLADFEAHRPLLVAFVEAFAQAERSPELREQLAGHYRRCRNDVAALVEAVLERSGAQPPAGGAAPRDAASFLVAVCDGFVLQWLLDPGQVPSGQAVISALRVLLGTSAAPAPTSAAGSRRGPRARPGRAAG